MLERARTRLTHTARQLEDITPGTSGNVSVCIGDRIAITPTATPYSKLEADDIVVISRTSKEQLAGNRSPSSELPLHLAIYRNQLGEAVVHTHAPWSTTLAVLEAPLPAIHPSILEIGDPIPVTTFAPSGTEALAEEAVAASRTHDSAACLLAKHGLVTTAKDLSTALERARTVEFVAQLYCQAHLMGTPVPLTNSERSAIEQQKAVQLNSSDKRK